MSHSSPRGTFCLQQALDPICSTADVFLLVFGCRVLRHSLLLVPLDEFTECITDLFIRRREAEGAVHGLRSSKFLPACQLPWWWGSHQAESEVSQISIPAISQIKGMSLLCNSLISACHSILIFHRYFKQRGIPLDTRTKRLSCLHCSLGQLDLFSCSGLTQC